MNDGEGHPALVLMIVTLVGKAVWMGQGLSRKAGE